MRRVVEREGGCIVWGGAVRLEPGRRHPDPGRARARSRQRGPAGRLGAVQEDRRRLHPCGARHAGRPDRQGAQRKPPTAARRTGPRSRWRSAFGLKARPVIEPTARQPVGRGIGPALEARDVLAVLQQCRRRAARSARARRCCWPARFWNWAARRAERRGRGAGGGDARRAAAPGPSSSASARRKAACACRRSLRSRHESRRRAPAVSSPSTTAGWRKRRQAGRRAGSQGRRGRAACRARRSTSSAAHPLYTVHAETPGELDYALDYAARQSRHHRSLPRHEAAACSPCRATSGLARGLAAEHRRRDRQGSMLRRFPDGESLSGAIETPVAARGR